MESFLIIRIWRPFQKGNWWQLFNGSIQDIYTSFRMNFAKYTVQNQTPKLVDLGIATINALTEVSGLSTPATRIWRPTDGDHWRAPDNIFGKTIAVVVSDSKSGYNYNYKTEF